jgi:hypothetical protein
MYYEVVIEGLPKRRIYKTYSRALLAAFKLSCRTWRTVHVYRVREPIQAEDGDKHTEQSASK